MSLYPCRPEPFDCAQGRLREGAGTWLRFLRCAEDDTNGR
jgi:hypothetical protein